MKKALLFVIFFISISAILAQPQKMTYQAVVRDNNNELVVNQFVGVKINISQDSVNGLIVFAETHSTKTNANGLFSVSIGTGTQLFIKTLADIDWAHHDYYLRVEIDPAGGSNYSIYGAQQLITVPYAFFAGKASKSDTSYFAVYSDTANYANNADYNNLSNRPAGTNTGDILYWETADSSWHIIPAGLIGDVLTMTPNNIPQWRPAAVNTYSLPIVLTDSVISITPNNAVSGVTVISDGGCALVVSGICWNVTPSPLCTDSHTTDGFNTGHFISSMTGLSPNTTYYVRAYATNIAGTAYGNEITFKTGASTICGTVTDYDGNTYNTLIIGSQCWMKENLKTTSYADGTSIALGSISSTNVAYRYYPNNNSNNVQTYGYLYNWTAVGRGASSSANPSGLQGICPTGWHLPSYAEFQQLLQYLHTQNSCFCNNNSAYISKALASTTGWSLTSSVACAVGNDFSTNNSSNFSAVPAGYYLGSYTEFGTGAYFYASDSGVMAPFIKYDSPSTGQISSGKQISFSVRCVKD